MDTGQGRFEQFNASNEKELNEKMELLQKKFTNHGGTFRIGETLEIRGSHFKIQKITPKKMTLKLLKRTTESDMIISGKPTGEIE